MASDHEVGLTWSLRTSDASSPDHCAPHEETQDCDCKAIIDPDEEDPDEVCEAACRSMNFEHGWSHGGIEEARVTGWRAYCGCYDILPQ
jgi:hypothetical protein